MFQPSYAMVTYKIRCTFIAQWFTTLVVIIFGLGLLASLKVPREPLSVSILVLSLVLLSNYLQRFTSRGVAEISINHSSLSIHWVSQSLLNFRRDRVYSIPEIESYRYQPFNNFDLFRLNLKDGTRFEIWHSTHFANDDFEKLVLEFPEIARTGGVNSDIIVQRNQLPNSRLVIRKEDSSHDLKDLILIACLAAVSTFASAYLLISGKANEEIGLTLLIVSLAGSFFFGVKLVLYSLRGRNSRD